MTVDSVSRVFSVPEHEDVILIQSPRPLNPDNSQYSCSNIIEEEYLGFLIYPDFIVIVLKCKSFTFKTVT